MSEPATPSSETGDDKAVYKVQHLAFRDEFVVASGPNEARESAAGGWDCGEFAYGEASQAGDRLCDVEELAELPNVGDTTVQRLLEADSPQALGPAAESALPKRDQTRLRNALDGNWPVIHQ